MEPSFREDDHVLTFNWSRLRIGNVIVFEKDGRHFIKRVEKIAKGNIYVTGDNQSESAKIGPVTFKEVIGRIILKY